MGDQDTGTTPATTGPDATSGHDDDAPLGAGGMRALEAERKARRDADQRASRAEARVAEMEAENLRREVATDKGIPVDLLAGTSREELEAHADRLLEFRGNNAGAVVTGRPKERLIPGAAPTAEPAQDMGKIAEQILTRGI